ANYAGDSQFNPGMGTASRTILLQATTIAGYTLPDPAADPPPSCICDDWGYETPVPLNSSVTGQPFDLTALVFATSSGISPPTGSVTFYDGAAFLGTSHVVDGQATLAVSGRAAGSYTFTFAYSGDANYQASVGTVTQIVSTGDTCTTLSTSPNPSV